MRLTAAGDQRLERLAALHLEELARRKAELVGLWDELTTRVVDDARNPD